MAEAVGLPLHRLVRYEDGPVGLVLIDSDAGYSYLLVVSAGWRLVDGDDLLDGSYHEADPDDLTYAQRLTGRQIEEIVVETTGDAVISLGTLQLTVWQAAAREPSLLWYRPGRESVVVGTGGSWSHAVLSPDDPLDEVARLAVEAADLPD
jgi:hypothetical protein